MPDTEARVRSGLQAYADTMSVHRPPLAELLSSADEADRSSGRRRTILAIAAAVVVLAGAVLLLRGPEEQVTVDSSGLPVVWPLGAGVSADVLRTPATAAEAYVHQALDLPPEWRNSGDSARQGRTANEQFALPDSSTTMRVFLVEIDELWFVTSARFDEGPTIAEARVTDEGVRVRASVPSDLAPPGGWVAELHDTEGAVVTTATMVDLEGDVRQADLSVPPGREPAAVTVRLEGEVPVSASTIVLPATIDDHPARSLFPGGSYYAVWTDTLTHPGDPRADWQVALTSLIGAVSTGVPANPTYDQVVERPDGFEMHGRFRTDDGGAGTFELARLTLDGPWFVTSLKDDAIEVRDVSVTASAVDVELVVREDYTLAVGHMMQPESSFGRGGVEMTFTRVVDPATGTAGTELVLAAVDDGGLFRFYDTWGPPG